MFYILYCVYDNPQLLIYSSPPFTFGNHKVVFYVSGSISFLYISSFASFLIPHVGNIMWYFFFSIRLTLLSMITSSLIKLLQMAFFLFLWLSNMPLWAFLVAHLVKICLQCRRLWFDSWARKIPWRRDRLPTPVFLDFLGGSDGKESTCNVEDLGSTLGSGRSP